MQKSKSLFSLGPSIKHTDVAQRPRARRKSSLDTLIIPGRTRFPSSQSTADATDIQVAQQLLNHNTMQNSIDLSRPNVAQPELPRHPQQQLAIQTSGNGQHAMSSLQRSQRARYQGRDRSAPLNSPQGVAVGAPHRRPQTCMPRSSSHNVMGTTSKSNLAGPYDGNDESNGSGRISRTTSMSWSMESNRVLSGSSGSSWASRASEYLFEYNDLAQKHGLHQIACESSEDESNFSETKTTQKSHPGWLARKIFRRTTSTYSLKAKATYKPVSKKKSLGGIQLLADTAPTNILTGKGLEEISRLGGLGILILPPEYAIDKLTLPTCLSAAAAHLLENGCNAPGLFRVSGTTSVINQLYNHYDHQFTGAGSPSKVEETVGPGVLPAQPEYALPDIASLFKKIIIGLPGGLLGSLELFEAFRSVLIDWKADPDLSSSEASQLQAKLIALAISSSRPTCRVHLIEAVLGLVAYFGFEAERTQAAERAAASDRNQPDIVRSELMGYQSLGVVLGPLLLGNLIDSVEVEHAGGDDNTADSPSTTRKSGEIDPDIGRRVKKQKRISFANKLDKDAELSAHVDRANLTAKVMQTLLVKWKEVVIQLRHLEGGRNPSLRSRRSPNPIRKRPSQAASKLTFGSSQEEPDFLTVLGGWSQPKDMTGEVKMKRKIKVKSRSPGGFATLKTSDDSDRPQSRLPETGVDLRGDRVGANTTQEPTSNKFPGANAREQSRSGSPRVVTEDFPKLNFARRTNSDLAMERMSMGTILPKPQEPPVSWEHDLLLPQRTPSETSRKKEHSRSFSDTPSVPETAVKIKASTEPPFSTIKLVGPIDRDKPLPSIGIAQKEEPSPRAKEDKQEKAVHRRVMSNDQQSWGSRQSANISPYTAREPTPRTLFPSRGSGHWAPAKDEESNYPPRQSSLPGEERDSERTIDPIPTFESLKDYKASRSDDGSSYKQSTSRRSSGTPRETIDAEDRNDRNSNGSVKFLTQRFTEASRATRNDEKARQAAKDESIQTVYAYVHPLPPAKSSSHDPFVTSPNPSPERESLIPKPIRDLGRSRQSDAPRSPSRTPSPPKRTAPEPSASQMRRSASAFGMVAEQDDPITGNITKAEAHHPVQSFAPDVSSNNWPSYTGRLRISAGTPNTSINSNADFSIPVRSRGDDQVEDTSHGLRTELRDPVLNPAIEDALSTQSDTGRLGVNPSNSLSRSNTYRNASNALKALSERHGSMRLNTTLYEQILQLQRQLDQRDEEVQTVRRSLDAVRDTSRERHSARGSPRSSWGRRVLNGEVAKPAQEDEITFWRSRAEEAEKKLAEKRGNRQSARVEVLVDTERDPVDEITDIYVGEGWGSEALSTDEDLAINGRA